MSMHVIADLVSTAAALHNEYDAPELQAAPWLDTHTAAVAFMNPEQMLPAHLLLLVAFCSCRPAVLVMF